MDQNNSKKKQVGATSQRHGSSSSTTTTTTKNLDHLFGPRDSLTSSASSSLFSSIFPPPSSTEMGRERGYGNTTSRVPPCNFNSSIYYGGQENYNVPKSAYDSKNHHQPNVKKDRAPDDDDDDSRGNWWKGSLYYYSNCSLSSITTL